MGAGSTRCEREMGELLPNNRREPLRPADPGELPMGRPSWRKSLEANSRSVVICCAVWNSLGSATRFVYSLDCGDVILFFFFP